ncbi:hypothetical protein V6N13_034615 [Hibiscus sabdariffa]
MCSLLYAMTQLESSGDDQVEWCNALSFFVRLVAYVSVLAVIVVVILLIHKYMTELRNGSGDSEDVTAATEPETDPVCPRRAIPITYGTCEDDVETGSCSSGEDLYDARICIICYDEQRNCFFVPCGHCATCYDCAQRVYGEENKVCPVCRRIIGKVRKLFAP